MSDSDSRFIEVSQLRPGMYVRLDLSWMEHPFPLGSFKITDEEQIRTIRALGLQRVRYEPAKSDFEALEDEDMAAVWIGAPMPLAGDALLRQQRQEQLDAQHRDLERCEDRFGEAQRRFRRMAELALARPELAAHEGQALVDSCVGELLSGGESAIRLLSEGHGDRIAQHAVNVMAISLLLGKALGLSEPELGDLGLAALLHDIGKSELPERVRYLDENFSAAERKFHQEHVVRGVALGRRMGVADEVLAAIAQHHEMEDGSGYPRGSKSGGLTQAGRILGLVNCYDNLCNPLRAANALTPHEALSFLFTRMRLRFDAKVLGSFIRMMGVYPPGSVVQLVNDCYAIVVSVNAARALRPRVMVHDSHIALEDALILDLDQTPELGIRRSLRASQLHPTVQAYLAPRQHLCYFFEQTQEAAGA